MAPHPRARYQQIAEDLAQAIRRGEYKPGDSLPTEQQLMERYGYSRPTVRQAMALLRAEGLVDVEHGRGSFVRARRPIRRVTSVRYAKAARAGKSPFRTEAEAAGMAGRGELLGVEIVSADPDVANWLEVEEGSEVVLRRRLFLADEEPVQIDDGYLPRDLVAGTDLEGPRLITEGTFTALERIGHKPLVCSEEVSARMPTAEEVDLLRLRQNVPVIDVVRVTRGAGGRVLQALRLVASAERNVFVYNDLPISSPRRGEQ